MASGGARSSSRSATPPRRRRARSPGRSPSPTPAPRPKTTAKATPNPTASTPERTIGVLLLAVFLDLFAVALVVPNLVFRWKELGISPERLGMVGSVYSASQILGGLVIGHLGDTRLGRKRVLLLSFLGAGVSYALVGLANSVELLVLSRVVVGLVKQTSTCSQAIVTHLTTPQTRATHLGRLSSAITLAFLVGQSVGGVIAQRYGRRAPCFLAASLYVVTFVLVQTLMPPMPPLGAPAAATAATAAAAAAAAAEPGGRRRSPRAAASAAGTTTSRLAGMGAGFRAAFDGPSGRVLLLRLSYGFLMRGTYSLHALYERERWELTPSRAGFLSSYKMGLGLLVDSLLVGFITKRLPERTILTCSFFASAVNAGLEASHSTFALYAGLNMPLSAAAGTVTRTTLSSLFSQSVPLASAGSALSVVDVANSAVGILAPLYGGLLLGRLGVSCQPLAACAHYVILVLLARAMLRDGAGGKGAKEKGKEKAR